MRAAESDRALLRAGRSDLIAIPWIPKARKAWRADSHWIRGSACTHVPLHAVRVREGDGSGIFSRRCQRPSYPLSATTTGAREAIRTMVDRACLRLNRISSRGPSAFLIAGIFQSPGIPEKVDDDELARGESLEGSR